MHRLGNYLRLGHSRGIKRGFAPSNLQRQAREIDDATITAIATEIVGSSHEDAIHGTGFHAKCAKHALGIINCKAGDLESLAVFDPFLADIDAVHRTSLGALVARNTGCQIVSMKAPIAGRDRDRLFRILENLGKGPAIRLIGDEPIAERDVESVADGIDRQPDIT